MEFREFYAKVWNSRAFFCEKRGECGNLSVKMDSRVRGNDGGNPHILREKLILEFPQNDRKIKFTIPANAGISAEIPIYIGMEKRRNFAKKRCHSRESGNLFGAINFGIFANFSRKFGIPAHFFCKKRGECGDLSVKMDSRVRGNDGGNPHILREKLILEFPQNDRKIKFTIPANAGISAEIPIYIGMEKRRNFAKKRRHSRESGNPFGAINFGILANFSRKFGIPAHFFAKNEVNAGFCR